MKKIKKLLLCAALTAVSVGMLSGCTISKEVMDDDNATVLSEDEVKVSVIGEWDVPGKDRVLEFKDDGTYVDNFSSRRAGTYAYMSQNDSFTIGDLFAQVEYIMCTDDNGDNVLNGALLGDVISSYSQLDRKELYYFRIGRDEVAQEDILGSWRCIDKTAYQLTLNEDGTAKVSDDSAVYTMTQDNTYGTGISLTVTHDGDEETTEYAVYPYEKYLFIYEIGSYNMYQLEPWDGE